jgi:plastocyanin
MRKLILLAVAVTALAGAGSGSAANTTVTITKASFVAANVSIRAGDTVSWTNTDTAAHQVAFDKAACNLTIQAGQSASCTFATAGSFNYRDPSQRGSFRGTVEVLGASTTTTIAASRATIVYGQSMTFNGQLASHRAGTSVELWAQAFGQGAFIKVTQVASIDNGSWTVTANPAIETAYQVRVGNRPSQSVTIKVRPRLTLGYSTVTRVFATKVVAPRSFAGKLAFFQRKSSLGQWITLKKVKLSSAATASFRSALPKGKTPVRVLLPATQTLPGYLAGTSPIRYVTR